MTNEAHVEGRCHCGNIALRLKWAGDPRAIPARACGCSFCVKHGGVWTSHPGSALTVRIQDRASVAKYEFGTRTATFHVCARCGVVPLVTSEIDGRLYAVVNVNVLEGLDPASLRRAPTSFEGEDVEARLARRKRNWIADVRIDEGGPAGNDDRRLRLDQPRPRRARRRAFPRPGETRRGHRRSPPRPAARAPTRRSPRARAGADVALFGAVGRDAFAAPALVEPRAAGVDLAGVARVDGATGVALINVDAHGENAITVVAGANAHARADAGARRARFATGTTLLMQLEMPHRRSRRARAARARARRARVVLNAAPAARCRPALLRHVDVLVVNEHEAAAVRRVARCPARPRRSSQPCTRVSACRGRRRSVRRGALCRHRRASRRTRRRPRSTSSTRTGAGDAFCGALAAALDRGRPLPRGPAPRACMPALLACTHARRAARLHARASAIPAHG